MATENQQPKPPSPPLEIGETVLVRIGKHPLSATVIEDFGARARDGGRILRIRVHHGEGVEIEHDARESVLERPRRRSRPSPRRARDAASPRRA